MANPSVVQPELHFRSRKILYAVITEYVATGEPVGSRRLAKRYGINLSAATIRNVLADLTELGYLSQPHTSAGRVPTERGFRVFVDALIQMRDVTSEDREAVLERMESGRIQNWHRRLAAAIEQEDAPDLEAVTEHLIGAKDFSRAGIYAIRAASLAMEAMARLAARIA